MTHEYTSQEPAPRPIPALRAMRMRFALFGRAREPERRVLATYVSTSTRRTLQLIELQDGRVRWTCDCDAYRRSQGARFEPWCKHTAKAAARRSVERLVFARHVTRAQHKRRG